MSGRTRSIVAATAALWLASTCSCVSTRIGDLESTLGRGPAAGATLAVDETEYHLSHCWSGDREYFLGVDLVDDSQQTVLRLAVDPMEGPRLRLTRGAGRSADQVSFSEGTCRELHAEVEPTGWRVNRVRDFKGEIRADCTSDSGVRLRAAVRFLHCH